MIDITRLEKDIGVEQSFSLERKFDGLSDEDMDLNFVTPVKVKGKLIKTGDGILAKGDIDCTISVICYRCAEKFDYRVSIPFEEQYVQKGSNKPDDDVNEYDDEKLDLWPAIKSNIHLNLPMKFLCSDDCKGLCTQCGSNLNTATCQCQDEKLDNPMHILKKLLHDDKEV
ncbi:MAG TPA: DUF177 domain-containing protein [Clostridiales bacterium]|nr:DUF177 domain-containing protein [Clostridiales bacterium]